MGLRHSLKRRFGRSKVSLRLEESYPDILDPAFQAAMELCREVSMTSIDRLLRRKANIKHANWRGYAAIPERTQKVAEERVKIDVAASDDDSASHARRILGSAAPRANSTLLRHRSQTPALFGISPIDWLPRVGKMHNPATEQPGPTDP